MPLGGLLLANPYSLQGCAPMLGYRRGAMDLVVCSASRSEVRRPPALHGGGGSIPGLLGIQLEGRLGSASLSPEAAGR